MVLVALDVLLHKQPKLWSPEIHTPNLSVRSLNQDFMLDGFKCFRLPSRNNAKGTYSFSYPHPFTFHIYLNWVLNFVSGCSGMTSGSHSQHCKVHSVKLIWATLAFCNKSALILAQEDKLCFIAGSLVKIVFIKEFNLNSDLGISIYGRLLNLWLEFGDSNLSTLSKATEVSPSFRW